MAQLGATATQGGSTATGSQASSAQGATHSHATNSETALAYATCMRAHGVPKFPDPTSRNELTSGLPKVNVQELGISGAEYETAQRACAPLLPDGGQPTASESQHDLSAMVSFARCIRSHQVTNWPDPTIGADGNPGFNLVGIRGIPASDAQFQQALHQCGHLVPHALGGIRVREPASTGSS